MSLTHFKVIITLILLTDSIVIVIALKDSRIIGASTSWRRYSINLNNHEDRYRKKKDSCGKWRDKQSINLTGSRIHIVDRTCLYALHF